MQRPSDQRTKTTRRPALGQRRRHRVLVAVAAVAGTVAATGCSNSSDTSHDGRLAVVDATIDWPANPDVASVQLTIKNDTESDDVLTEVTSNAGTASVHRSTTDAAGRSTMKPIERLDVPSGKTIEFKPGGLHVMLKDPPAALEIGDKVSLTFRFEKSGLRTVQAQVIEPGTAADMPSHDE